MRKSLVAGGFLALGLFTTVGQPAFAAVDLGSHPASQQEVNQTQSMIKAGKVQTAKAIPFLIPPNKINPAGKTPSELQQVGPISNAKQPGAISPSTYTEIAEWSYNPEIGTTNTFATDSNTFNVTGSSVKINTAGLANNSALSASGYYYITLYRENFLGETAISPVASLSYSTQHYDYATQTWSGLSPGNFYLEGYCSTQWITGYAYIYQQ